MTLYQCRKTGEIRTIPPEEAPFGCITAQFCAVMPYAQVYAQERQNFANLSAPLYALPFTETPVLEYHGMDGRAAEDFEELVLTDVQDALDILECSEVCRKHELLFVRLAGEREAAPEGWEWLGFDVGYVPQDAAGAFSIICDCMFLPRWHGCDAQGTEFLAEFLLLNAHGLFDTCETAQEYLRHYLEQDWTERGEFGILEIFRMQKIAITGGNYDISGRR